MNLLKGKVALVALNNFAIGEGIVLSLTAEGACVAIINLEIAMIEAGFEVLALRADIKKCLELHDAIDRALSWRGAIDIIVLQVANFDPSGTDNYSSQLQNEEQLYRNNEDNINSTIALIIPFLSDEGRVIIIGVTTAGRYGFSDPPEHELRKTRLASIAKIWAMKLTPKLITVNVIQPGIMLADSFPRDLTYLNLTHYDPPVIQQHLPEEIGYAVVFFASEGSFNYSGYSVDIVVEAP